MVSEHKYQGEGGPSLKQCFELVRNISSVPLVDLQSLLKAVLFNLLIGNNDAHGKNFSLIYRADGQTRLAPLYDLVSTAAYPELSARMAMKIGGEYDSEKVGPRQIEKLADEAALSVPMGRCCLGRPPGGNAGESLCGRGGRANQESQPADHPAIQEIIRAIAPHRCPPNRVPPYYTC
jgi:hypothetical protein